MAKKYSHRILALLLINFSLAGCTTTAITNSNISDNINVKTVTSIAGPSVEADGITGNYRCWQFNVDGYGGSCRALSPIVLAVDGSYSISSTHGTYTMNGDMILLSESEYWGPGTMKESGQQIYFNYTYKDKHYEVTYLKE